MTEQELIVKEIENLPKRKLTVVLDFIQFLKSKKDIEISDLALASEESLKREWLLPEEDKAWKEL